jgi:isopentenyldiphosphate isomerase
MINKDEIIFAVDKNNQPIGPVARKKAHAEGIWHRTSDVVVVNSKKEILCNKRSMHKDNSPGKWDVYFGGHVSAGTEPLECAIRELEEETGLMASESDLEFVLIDKHSNNNYNNEFTYVYLFHWDGEVIDLKLEQEEIDEAVWVKVDDLLKEYLNDSTDKWTHPPYVERFLKSL